jgi:hypothetical protein
VDAWTISPSSPPGSVELTLRTGPPRPLAATLTEAELVKVTDVLPEVAEAVSRGEFSRIQLGKAFQAAIGRDPFRQVGATPRRRGLFVWWADLAFGIVSLDFAATNSNLWLKLTGWAFAAIALVDLAGHVWRWKRQRDPARR